jgi:ribosomal protein L1
MTEFIIKFREISFQMHAQKANIQTCVDNRESFDQAKIIRTYDVAVPRQIDARHAETNILHL